MRTMADGDCGWRKELNWSRSVERKKKEGGREAEEAKAALRQSPRRQTYMTNGLARANCSTGSLQ